MIIEVEVRVECDECGEEEVIQFGDLPNELRVRKAIKDELEWTYRAGDLGPEYLCPECQQPE